MACGVLCMARIVLLVVLIHGQARSNLAKSKSARGAQLNNLTANVTGFFGNGPDEDLSGFDRETATRNIGEHLYNTEEIDGILCDLENSTPLLAWLASTGVPDEHLRAFQALDRAARMVRRLIDDECDALNSHTDNEGEF